MPNQHHPDCKGHPNDEWACTPAMNTKKDATYMQGENFFQHSGPELRLVSFDEKEDTVTVKREELARYVEKMQKVAPDSTKRCGNYCAKEGSAHGYGCTAWKISHGKESSEEEYCGSIGCCTECAFYLDYKDDWQCNGGIFSAKCTCHPEYEKDLEYINRKKEQVNHESTTGEDFTSKALSEFREKFPHYRPGGDLEQWLTSKLEEAYAQGRMDEGEVCGYEIGTETERARILGIVERELNDPPADSIEHTEGFMAALTSLAEEISQEKAAEPPHN